MKYKNAQPKLRVFAIRIAFMQKNHDLVFYLSAVSHDIFSFFFSLTQLDVPPKTFIFYNGGAKLTCEGSPVLEDIQTLIANGADVMTCGTCLTHYGLTDRLRAGRITNMYEIAETMTGAKKLVKP